MDPLTVLAYIGSTGNNRLSTDTIDDDPAPIDDSDFFLLCKTSH